MRTTEKTITFQDAFVLKGVDGQQPAGQYLIITDEEQITTTLFDAWRRVKTQIRLPAVERNTGMEQYSTIDPVDLESALRSDAVDRPSG